MLAMTLAINRQTVRDLRHPEPLVVHRSSFLVGGIDLHVVMISVTLELAYSCGSVGLPLTPVRIDEKCSNRAFHPNQF